MMTCNYDNNSVFSQIEKVCGSVDKDFIDEIYNLSTIAEYDAKMQSEVEFSSNIKVSTNSLFKVFSWNICGDFKGKVEVINEVLCKQSPDVFFVLESRLFKEEEDSVSNLFPGYDCFFNSHSKEMALQNQENGTVFRKGGVVCFVKCHWKVYITEVTFMEDKSSICLSFTFGSDSLIVHGVYAPAVTSSLDKDMYWSKWLNTLPKVEKCNVIVIGDFNVQIDPGLDNGNKDTGCNVPESLENILASGYVDVFRHCWGSKKKFSFWRNCVNTVQCTRIDTCLAHFSSVHALSCDYTGVNVSVSPDHLGVILTVDLQLLLNKVPCEFTGLPVYVQDTYDVNSLCMNKIKYQEAWQATVKSKDIIAFKTLLDLALNNKDTRSVEAAYKLLLNIICKNVSTVAGISSRLVNASRKTRVPRKLLVLYENLNRITKVILNFHRIELGDIPSCVKKLKFNLPQYRCPLPIDADSSELINWMFNLQRKEKELRKLVSKLKFKKRREFIVKAIQKIHDSLHSNPKAFFRRVNVCKVKSADKLTILKKVVPGASPVIISDRESITAEVAFFWQSVFKAPSLPLVHEEEWFNSSSFRKVVGSLKGKDGELMRVITVSELKEVLKRMGNRKATGPDRLPAEAFKLMPDVALEEICRLFNVLLKVEYTPMSWKDSWIFTILKPREDPMLLNSYRPITLLNVFYKLFANVLNGRLNRLLDKQSVISTSQAGFRKNRCTIHRANALVNLIHRAKTLGCPIHLCYIDFKKAYDSVPHQRLARCLLKYGFSESFINLIVSLYQQNTSKVITSYGFSRSVEVNRGVRQGCPLSPTLFSLFLDPLLLWLSESCEGFEDIQVLAYADDLVLVSKSYQDLQSMLDKVCKFSFNNGMSISTDSRAKSVYTTSDPDESLALQVTNWTSGCIEKINLPRLKPSESYKYLGILVNVNLDWSEEIASSVRKFGMQTHFLRNKCFTPRMLVDIMNKVVIPGVRYRMNVVRFPKYAVARMHRAMAALIFNKLSITQFSSIKHLQLDFDSGGFMLRNLYEVQDEAALQTLTVFGANSSDVFARRTTEVALADKSSAHSKLALRLKRLGGVVKFNPLRGCKESLLSNWLPKRICNLLGGLSRVQDLFVADRLLSQQRLFVKLEGSRKLGTKGYSYIKKTLTVNGIVKQELREVLGLPLTVWDANSFCHFTTDKFVRVWTDGSAVTDDQGRRMAGYGIWGGDGCKFNGSFRAVCRQTNYSAELQAILHVVKHVAFNTEIVTDCMAGKAVIQSLERYTDSKWSKVCCEHILKDIFHSINKKKLQGIVIRFVHVFSHLCDYGVKKDEQYFRKLNVMKSRFGNDVDVVLKGNKEVDRLALLGTRLAAPACPKYTKFMPNVVIEALDGTFIDNPAGYIKSVLRSKFRQDYKKSYRGLVRRVRFKSRVCVSPIFKSDNHLISSEQNFAFKVVHSKLPLCSVVFKKVQEEVAKKNAGKAFYSKVLDLADVYNSPACKLCGHHSEDVVHLALCSRTKHMARVLPIEINRVINVYVRESNKSRNLKKPVVKWFPAWYSYLPSPIGVSEKLLEVMEFDHTLGLLGFMPPALAGALIEVGVSDKLVTKCMLSIQVEVFKNLESRWRMRCKIFWSSG
jgi:exonuclease III/ribonuclease HI